MALPSLHKAPTVARDEAGVYGFRTPINKKLKLWFLLSNASSTTVPLYLTQVDHQLLDQSTMAVIYKRQPRKSLRLKTVIFLVRNVPDALNISDVDYHFVWAKDCNEHWKSLRTISRSEMFSSKAIEAESNLRHENKDFLDLNDEHGTAHWIKFGLKKALENGMTPNVSDFFPILRALDLQGLRRDSFKRLEEELFIAGTDTVVSTIEWAMAELLKNKEILDKVHKELKRELNSNSIMKSDLSKLTYFNACVKETLRLHPVVPLLIPRRALEACEVMNYTIPQNSQVWVNIWAISRDPKVWEDPDTFKPERFVGSHLDFSGRDFEFIPFGGGRRMCPGLPSAIKSLQTILASLILEYDWVLPNDEDPKNLDMNEKFGVTLQKEKPLELIFKHKSNQYMA
nr:cytochrome P450 [Tanacetum cinerariifolium]